MKPVNAISHHAQRRAEERYGIELSIDEIERQIACSEARVYKRENRRIWGILVRTAEGYVPIIYNVALKTVLTVLPKSELFNIQEQYGRGFASDEAARLFFAGLSDNRRREIQKRRDECDLLDPFYNVANVRRAQELMAFVDSLPDDVRKIVHEHGHHIVMAFWQHGIRGANDIAILIEASRRSASADSRGLILLYRHFGAKSDYSAHYVATVVRLEPPPKCPDQGFVRQEKPRNRKRNPLEVRHV